MAASEIDTPVIADEEQRLVDRVPAAVALCRLYLDSSNNTVASMCIRCGAIMRKIYCVACRKKEIEAREAVAKAEEEEEEEERREEEACQHIKGECNRCGETGTYLNFCNCGGTFEAIAVKNEDDHTWNALITNQRTSRLSQGRECW